MRYALVCILGMLGGPATAHTETIPRFNLSLTSYRNCSLVLSHPIRLHAVSDSYGPYRVPEQQQCWNTRFTYPINREGTLNTVAWLRLNSRETGLRMIGLGFTVRANEDTYAKVRIRKSGVSITFGAAF